MRTHRELSLYITSLFLITLSTLSLSTTAHALGELVVSPTRIIFEKHTRTASVSMANAGNETKTYRIQFVERRMTPEGGFEEVKQPKPGELFASKMIRFSPRQVTLQPGQAQSVRLMLRKPANLANGEYRSHLLFRAIPKASTSSVKNLTGDSKAITITLTPVVGISIPVIMRHGPIKADINIDKLRYFSGNKSVIFDMNRSGLSSVYGDITIQFKNQKGETAIIKRINGLAIYSPNPSRRISVKLTAPDGVKLQHGTLIVNYNENKDVGGRLIAQKSIPIP